MGGLFGIEIAVGSPTRGTTIFIYEESLALGEATSAYFYESRIGT